MGMDEFGGTAVENVLAAFTAMRQTLLIRPHCDVEAAAYVGQDR